MKNVKDNSISSFPVCQSLSQEHRETEALLNLLHEALFEISKEQSPAAWEKARTTLLTLTAEMNTHFLCEEQGLFPLLSKYHPMVLMEVEHEEILALRHELNAALSVNNLSKEHAGHLFRLGERFIEELRNHIAREDSGIFPMAERDMSAIEKEEALKAMENIRRRASVMPTPEIVRPPKTHYPFHIPLFEPLTKNVMTSLLLEKDDLQIKTLALKAGSKIAKHWAPKQIVLVLLSGEAECSSAETVTTLHPYDGILMDPRLEHALCAKSDCRFLMILNPV